MLKNRAIQVKMVKNDNGETTKPTPSDQFMVMAAATRVVSAHMQKTIVTVGKVILTYIAADTIRQVMVAKASK